MEREAILGDIVRFDGRTWIVVEIEPDSGDVTLSRTVSVTDVPRDRYEIIGHYGPGLP